ncbi:MAG: energy transducer TonB [Deltaproteobacteria bacterium]|nr:energy transducer TonB [Deltaproteobacteria bacterium]
MKTRLVVCFALSVFLHALILIMPWQVMARGGAAEQQEDPFPVNLVKQIEELKTSIQEAEEGLSFEVEGKVSVDYLERLKARIFYVWEYPKSAIEQGFEGTVRICFVLDASGWIIDNTLVSSSGFAELDQAALIAVENAGPFGPFSEDINQETLKITGNFCYVID